VNQKKPAQRLFHGVVGAPPDLPDPLGDSEPATPAPVPAFPAPIPYRSAADLCDELEAEKKSKRAAAARTRRKLQADQLKNIKVMMQKPIAEVKAEAAAKLKDETFIANPNAGMSAGAFMQDAPTGKGKIVSGGYDSAKVDLITGFEVAEEHTLGGHVTASNDTAGGRRHVTPEGNGPDADFNRDEGEFNLQTEEGPHGWPVAPSRSFQVRSNSDGQHDVERALESLCAEYFVDGVCRLCFICCHDIADAKDHILTVHGDEDDPLHDARFGDTIKPRIRKILRDDRKRAKEGKKMVAAHPEWRAFYAKLITDGMEEIVTIAEAERAGFVATETWTPVDGKGWMREWIKRKSVTG
jgi:hypothetical protein